MRVLKAIGRHFGHAHDSATARQSRQRGAPRNWSRRVRRRAPGRWNGCRLLAWRGRPATRARMRVVIDQVAKFDRTSAVLASLLVHTCKLPRTPLERG